MTKNMVAVKRAEKQSRLQTILNRGAVVLTLGATGVQANAATSYDTTAIISDLGAAVVAAAAIGVAWLGFTAGIAIWRNLRAAAR
ncbi:major capsid protein [Acinetobacter bereziniae]|uniref:major capsid protein n=1 Tax=Acinetobacter bereziniae TaxID=106648 RepID=UPI001115C5B3|nr:major capsid protein [Acinetobacter bereziniae]TNL43668.1 hypothetical protein EYB59_21770 [Acinetobacter bereziniae]TNL54213.1 hypothetical protein EYY58_18665 [Acinetobacter bereziniae]